MGNRQRLAVKGLNRVPAVLGNDWFTRCNQCQQRRILRRAGNNTVELDVRQNRRGSLPRSQRLCQFL